MLAFIHSQSAAAATAINHSVVYEIVVNSCFSGRVSVIIKSNYHRLRMRTVFLSLPLCMVAA